MRKCKDTKPLLVSIFRYSIHDQEAMANVYPHVLAKLATSAQVHHFCGKGESRHWLADQPGVTIHELPISFKRSNNIDKWFKTILWFILAFRIARWARQQKVDLIYIGESLPWLAWVIQLVSGRPTSFAAADMFWDVYLPDSRFFIWLKRLFLRLDIKIWKKARGLITHTMAFKNYAVQAGVNSDRLIVLPEACNIDNFYPIHKPSARQIVGYKDNEIVILHHGMLVPNKNLDKMLEYIEPVLKTRPNTRLELAGDGPLRKKLESIVKQMNLDKQIQFSGWIHSTSHLNNLINAADISIVIREGRFSDHFQFTGNMLHSVVCGSAILATRLQGISEIIEEGVNGLLFDPSDSREFASKLTKLIDDAPLRDKLGNAALKTATEKMNPERITEDWVAALKTFLEPQKLTT